MAVTVPQFSNASENVLFRPAVVATPAGTRAAGPASWTAGRYVMQIEGSDGYERWLGFDIRLISVGPTRDRHCGRVTACAADGAQRRRGSWSISKVARATMTRPIPVSHRPGIRVTTSAGSLIDSAPIDARLKTREAKASQPAVTMIA